MTDAACPSCTALREQLAAKDDWIRYLWNELFPPELLEDVIAMNPDVREKLRRVMAKEAR